MYDTIKMVLPRAEVEGCDFMEKVAPCIENKTTDEPVYFGGVPYQSGWIGKLKVSINPYRVKIEEGSLCKWFLGDNFQSLGRGNTKRAFEKLSDTLHLPIERAIITRLDFGKTFIVEEPTGNYFNHLGMLRYAKRLEEPTGMYYYLHRKAEVLCIYDKIEESREHREPIPDLYKGKNVLRYELRYMKSLPRLLNVTQVTGATLYDEAFYISLFNRWRDGYRAIDKIREITPNFSIMKGKKEFNLMGRLALIERFGGEVEMLKHIEEARKRGELNSAQVFDLKAAIKEASQMGEGFTSPSQCITELDKKIARAAKYYR